MLTDTILNFFSELFFRTLDLIPDPGLPEWLTGSGPGTLDGAMTWVSTNLGPMAGWVNFELLASAVLAFLAIDSLMFVFRMVARLFGFVRGGGL